MAQHDYVIDNQSFPATRTDINNVLLAISSTNSGTSAPSTTYANQLWYDTTNNKLYIRNEDNDAWIPLFLLDQSNDVASTLATEIDVEDASGTDTAGTALTIKGGAGTGTGAGGSIIFQTADGAGSTGSSVNSHATRVTIADDGDVGIGTTTPTHTFGSGLEIERAGISTMRVENTTDSVAGEISAYSSSLGMLVYTTTAHPIVFGTSGGEKMRLEAGGDFLVGRTDNSVGVGGDGLVLKAQGSILFVRDGTTSQNHCTFINNADVSATIVGTIKSSGSSTSYNTSSDYRLKENIANLTGAIDRVKTLSPKRFNFIADPDTTVDGFLAHEVTAVPEAIDGTKDETETIGNVTDADGNTTETGVVEPDELETGHTWTATGTQPVYQGIDQSKLVPLLTAALQEAIAKIEALETRIAELEG